MVSAGKGVRSWGRQVILLKLGKDHCPAVNVTKPRWAAEPRRGIMTLSALDNQNVGDNDQIKEMSRCEQCPCEFRYCPARPGEAP